MKILDRLEIGAIDLLVAIAYSEERSKKYDFKRPALVMIQLLKKPT
jgi:hypothetical protein